jgi:hypothetical protein
LVSLLFFFFFFFCLFCFWVINKTRYPTTYRYFLIPNVRIVYCLSKLCTVVSLLCSFRTPFPDICFLFSFLQLTLILAIGSRSSSARKENRSPDPFAAKFHEASLRHDFHINIYEPGFGQEVSHAGDSEVRDYD